MEDNGGLPEPRATSVEPVPDPPAAAGSGAVEGAVPAGQLPVDRSDEWTGWKPVIVIVAILGALPVLVLAVAYIAHIV